MRGRSCFPPVTFPESVTGWQSTWFYCKDVPTPGQSTGLPPFTLERLQSPRSLVVVPDEKEAVQLLVVAVVELVKGGVTGMDLLVFQPLQALNHPMWMYSGSDDTARTHPEEVDEEMVAQWLRSVTGNKDNPRGAKRILPFDATHAPREVRLAYPTDFSFYLCRVVVLESDSYTWLASCSFPQAALDAQRRVVSGGDRQ